MFLKQTSSFQIYNYDNNIDCREFKIHKIQPPKLYFHAYFQPRNTIPSIFYTKFTQTTNNIFIMSSNNTSDWSLSETARIVNVFLGSIQEKLARNIMWEDLLTNIYYLCKI